MPEYNAIDINVVKKIHQMGGNSFLVKLTNTFVTHADEKIADVIEGEENKNFVKISKASHALQSSAGNFGAQKLLVLCQNIETWAKQEDLSSISSSIPQLLDGFEQVKEDLFRFIEEQKDEAIGFS